ATLCAGVALPGDRVISHVHLDLVADYLDFVSGHIPRGGRGEVMAGRHVEMCSVPGAGHLVPLHVPLGKGPTAMRTSIVNGMKSPTDVEQSYLAASHCHKFGLPRWNLLDRGHFRKSHGYYLQ